MGLKELIQLNVHLGLFENWSFKNSQSVESELSFLFSKSDVDKS